MTTSVSITGGAGVIGASLAERRLDRGSQVTVFDNFHPQLADINRANAARLTHRGAQVEDGNICEPVALQSALDRASPNVIYHLAAETGTGPSYDHPARHTHVNVTGPGQCLGNTYTGVLSLFLRRMTQGKTLHIFEDGNITRDFLYIDDAVFARKCMGEVDRKPADPVDIGAGEPTTLLSVARQMLQQVGRDETGHETTGAFRPGDIRHAPAGTATAGTSLGRRPKVDLTTGLGRLIQWGHSQQDKAT